MRGKKRQQEDARTIVISFYLIFISADRCQCASYTVQIERISILPFL